MGIIEQRRNKKLLDKVPGLVFFIAAIFLLILLKTPPAHAASAKASDFVGSRFSLPSERVWRTTNGQRMRFQAGRKFKIIKADNAGVKYLVKLIGGGGITVWISGSELGGKFNCEAYTGRPQSTAKQIKGIAKTLESGRELDQQRRESRATRTRKPIQSQTQYQPRTNGTWKSKSSPSPTVYGTGKNTEVVTRSSSRSRSKNGRLFSNFGGRGPSYSSGAIPVNPNGRIGPNKGGVRPKLFSINECAAHQSNIAFVFYMQKGRPLKCRAKGAEISVVLKEFLEKYLNQCVAESISQTPGQDQNARKKISQVQIHGQGIRHPKSNSGGWSNHTWGGAIDISDITVRFSDGSMEDYPAAPVSAKYNKQWTSFRHLGKYRNARGQTRHKWDRSGKAVFQERFRNCLESKVNIEKRGRFCRGGAIDCEVNHSHFDHTHLSAPLCAPPEGHGAVKSYNGR